MIGKELIKKYEELVFKGDIDNAVKLLLDYEQVTSRKKVVAFLVGMGHVEYIGMLVYQTTLLLAEVDDRYIEASIEVLSHPLCYLPGAYEVAVYLSRKLCNTYPNELEYWKIYLNSLESAFDDDHINKEEEYMVKRKIKELS